MKPIPEHLQNYVKEINQLSGMNSVLYYQNKHYSFYFNDEQCGPNLNEERIELYLMGFRKAFICMKEQT